MKKFRINVNGKSYDVEVEELGGASVASAPVYTAPAPVAAPAPAPVAAPAPAPTPAPAQAAAPKEEAAPAPAPAAAPVAVPANATKITAPMPGTIVNVVVNVGDTVEKGQVLVIIEAMKMENEIVAPVAGKVVAISTSKGSSVNAGDLLLSLA